MLNAEQKIAVISGGSSGIGRAFVAALHEAGWRICASGRDAEKLRQLERDFPGVRTIVCDVADRDAVATAAAAILGEEPRIDLLISNAGGLVEIDFTTPALGDLDLTAEIRSNLIGAIDWIAAFLPGLRRASEGRIIIVGSGYGVAPVTRAPVYSAAKAGLHGFAKALRRQLAPLGIGVTEVLPPLVDTPAVAHRQGKKLSAAAIATETLNASARKQEEVYPGQARMLPLMLRLAPRFIEKMVAAS